MESPGGLGGSYAQEFRSLGEIRGKKRKFCGGHLEFCHFSIEKYNFWNGNILNGFFDLENVGFNTKIMSL